MLRHHCASLWAVIGALTLSCARPSPVAEPPRIAAGQVSGEWYAGGPDCGGAPRFRVHAYNPDFYILRQPACTNYEKPFLYLVFGRDRALLLDTGAGKVDVVLPIDSLMRAHAARVGGVTIPLVVAHSHAHGDHVAGDTLLAKRPNTTVVGRDTGAVRAFYGIQRWPADSGIIDLGGRVLDVLPIPGHQPASIALYDRATGILLTGDTFYPGRLYVRDTASFSRSVARLAAFARTHRVTHILGTHIENSSTASVDYPVGTVDQPHEHALDLTTAQLFELDSVVQAMRGRFTRTIRRDFTVWPQP
jgi:hydroxyacylglutathione hydrolase